MTLSNIKTMKRDRGFTIVELLIVIVVIGILAAITIVAYNGVQSRANTTKNDTIAKEIANKAEVYYADPTVGGVYPTVVQLTGAASTTTYALSAAAVAAIQSGTAIIGKVQYLNCGPNLGYKVTGFDYSTQLPSTTVRTGGNFANPCT